jgi:hypothetical protein
MNGGTNMRRTFSWFLLCIVFASPVWSQEEDADAVAEEEQTEATPEVDEVDEADEPIVDDEFYQDVDDKDFRPSEDIPADQSIPFPSDI